MTACAQDSSELATTNKNLMAEVERLKLELDALERTAMPRADRELQTFEDMYVACQLAHPEWRYLGTED